MRRIWASSSIPAHVSEEISGCDFLDLAWLMEQNRANWSEGDGDLHKGGRPRRGEVRAVRGRLNDNGYYLGCPVDVAQLADGSLLVSDDLVGALYRITL